MTGIATGQAMRLIIDVYRGDEVSLHMEARGRVSTCETTAADRIVVLLTGAKPSGDRRPSTVRLELPADVAAGLKRQLGVRLRELQAKHGVRRPVGRPRGVTPPDSSTPRLI